MKTEGFASTLLHLLHVSRLDASLFVTVVQ